MCKKYLLALLVCTLSGMLHISCYAQSQTKSISELQDCNTITVPNLDNVNLTREEKVKLLDGLLVDPLNRAVPCDSTASASNGDGSDSGNSDSDGGLQGTGSEYSQGKGESQGDSTASAGLQGTESDGSGTGSQSSASEGGSQGDTGLSAGMQEMESVNSGIDFQPSTGEGGTQGDSMASAGLQGTESVNSGIGFQPSTGEGGAQGDSMASAGLQGTGSGSSGTAPRPTTSEGGTTQGNATASTDIPGTESVGSGIDSQPPAGGEQGVGSELATLNTASAASNGQVPEDIPPADHDSIIARQLREAAMEETDPAKQAELWNEYRKHKNLPLNYGSYAQGSIGGLSELQDCNTITAPNLDNVNLTREEKIELLDGLLMESLHRAPCDDTVSASNSGSSDSDGELQGTGSEYSQTKAESQGDATASAEMQGTELAGSEIDSQSPAGGGTQGDAIASANMQGTESADSEVDSQPPAGGGGEQGAESELATLDTVPPTPTNGQLPEDIPPVDNDSIIARQLREAAMEETDPVKQAELWNKYRRYKGLPLK